MATIDAIDGVGPKSARTLRKAGVRTTEGLLKRTATRKGRGTFAEEVGLAPEQILAWANRADLLRIKGIGSEYAVLLEKAGIETIRELRRRNAKTLVIKMTEINDKKRLVRRLPTESMVAGWIEGAKALEPMVKP